MATNVQLTPELERFARQCVAEGRYNNVSEVVRSALRLLQDLEEQRRQFTATLDEAIEESDRSPSRRCARARRRSLMQAGSDCRNILAASAARC